MNEPGPQNGGTSGASPGPETGFSPSGVRPGSTTSHGTENQIGQSPSGSRGFIKRIGRYWPGGGGQPEPDEQQEEPARSRDKILAEMREIEGRTELSDSEKGERISELRKEFEGLLKQTEQEEAAGDTGTETVAAGTRGTGEGDGGGGENKGQEPKVVSKKGNFFLRFLDRLTEPSPMLVEALRLAADDSESSRQEKPVINPKTLVLLRVKSDERQMQSAEQPTLEVVEVGGEYQPKKGGNFEKLPPEMQQAIINTYQDHQKLSRFDLAKEEEFNKWLDRFIDFQERKAAKGS